MGVFGIETAEANGAHLALREIELDAGHVLEEFADVAFGDIAKHVRGDGIGDVHGIALVHDRLRVALALGGDFERREFGRTFRVGRGGGLHRADQLDVARDGAARRNFDGRRDRAETSVGHNERDRSGSDRRNAVVAAVLGSDDLARRIDADLGIAEVFAGRRAKHAASDRAGSRAVGNGKRGEKKHA